MNRPKRWSPWRDALGRFARVTPSDVAESIRDESRRVYIRATKKRATPSLPQPTTTKGV